MLAGRSLSSRKCKFFLNPTEKHPFGHVCMKKDLYLSYPGRTNVSCISLQTWRPAHMNMRNKKRVGSAIRVTHLAGSPFFDGRVNFSPHKHFGVSSVNWIKGKQSEHAQALLSALGFKLLARAKRSNFLAKVDSAGRVTLFPGRDNFARYKRVLKSLDCWVRW